MTAFLLVWGIALQAPLEEPASSVKTPNPSKAPWYFLGLQEMLVYYDPWMAGVVLPSLIVVGLMAIPYIDFNKRGTATTRSTSASSATCMFQFGFLRAVDHADHPGHVLPRAELEHLRPFEYWDAHKVLALNNVDLSQYFWISGLNRGMPKAPPGSGMLTELLLHSAGASRRASLLMLFYFSLLPPLMATTMFRKFFVKMGFIRYMLMANLLLFMAALPIKMVLRWVVQLEVHRQHSRILLELLRPLARRRPGSSRIRMPRPMPCKKLGQTDHARNRTNMA